MGPKGPRCPWNPSWGGEHSHMRRFTVLAGAGAAVLTREGGSTTQGLPEPAPLSGLHNCKGVLFPGTFRSKDVVLRLGAAISISLENS